MQSYTEYSFPLKNDPTGQTLCSNHCIFIILLRLANKVSGLKFPLSFHKGWLTQMPALLFIPRRTVIDFAYSPSLLLQKRAQVVSALFALIVIFSNEILCVKETQEK